MLKRILVSALAALAISSTLANSFAATTTATNIHAMDAYVNGIGVEYITFRTADGNGWAIYYEDGWEGGEQCVLVFNDMGTETIYDDELIAIVRN